MLNEDLLKEIVETPSVSGFEENIRNVMKKYLSKYVDEIIIDNVGNIIAKKGNGNPVIAIIAHMDQLGLIVKYIDKNGFIKFEPIGGWDDRILVGQKVKIYTKNGVIIGVIGIKPIHLLEGEEKKTIVKIKDMFIDIGAKNRKEVEKSGIRIGDFITMYSEVHKLRGKRYTGAGFDNRIGCFEMIEIARRLKKINGCVYFIGSVKEEIGIIGARGAIFKIKPDIVIGVDVTVSGDTPDIKESEAIPKLGMGATISIKDAINIIDPLIRDKLEEIAEKNKIKIQYDVLEKGATDSSIAPIIGEGVQSITILTPCRYLHSHVELVDIEDVENVIKLVCKIVENINILLSSREK